MGPGTGVSLPKKGHVTSGHKYYGLEMGHTPPSLWTDRHFFGMRAVKLSKIYVLKLLSIAVIKPCTVEKFSNIVFHELRKRAQHIVLVLE